MRSDSYKGLATLTPSVDSVRRTRVLTGLIATVIAVGLAILGAWPSAIGLAVGTLVGAGVVGSRFISQSRQARRFVVNTGQVALRIVGVGVALIVVGLWFWPVEILGVFLIAQRATALPVAVSAAKETH